MRLQEVLVAVWGVLGVALLLCNALWRLTPVAWEAIQSGLHPTQWAVTLGWVATSAYSEGYVGFHQKFSPRVARRAVGLGRNPSFLRVLFAAPYCMGLFAADRRTRIVSWTLLVGIALLVFVVRHVDQPWRGIIDAGVVVGLGIGLVSLLIHFVWAIRGASDG